MKFTKLVVVMVMVLVVPAQVVVVVAVAEEQYKISTPLKGQHPNKSKFLRL